MSKIIQPFGRVMQRITVEVDVKGQVKCEAEQFTLLGDKIPGGVPALQVIGIFLALSQAQVQQILQAGKGINGGQKTEKSGSD